MLRRVDGSGDGQVDKTELVEWCERQPLPSTFRDDTGQLAHVSPPLQKHTFSVHFIVFNLFAFSRTRHAHDTLTTRTRCTHFRWNEAEHLMDNLYVCVCVRVYECAQAYVNVCSCVYASVSVCPAGLPPL